MSPIEQFQADRARAREAGDPMAAVCVLATADEHGHPGGPNLGIATGRKGSGAIQRALTTVLSGNNSSRGGSINTYWPSIEIQYRMRFTTQLIDPAVVAASWQYRPDTPKRMDWFYQLQQPQSTAIGSREELEQGLNSLSLPDPITAPTGACGLLIKPTMLERLDLNELSGLHDRRRYTLTGAEWREEVLVP